ncbi:MAG: hypothetical protein H0U89_11625, partial [Acidimicrobiia bacterium]|nr:hypothetical protein [Acidimicrobiia bacterium]
MMDRFRVLDEIEPPDQWDEVVERIGRPETAAGVERRRRRPVGVLVAVAAVVALLVGAVAYRVADDGEGGRDQVRTDSPTTTAANEGAQLPPAPGPLACPPELLDISALGLAEPPFLLPPDERAGPDDAEKYVARWPVEEQTVEVQLPVPGVIDFAGERTEQVGEELLWYREGSVQLRFGPYPDGRCSFGVTVYGPDEAANAARAVEVGRAIRVRELLAPGSWQEVAAPGLVGVYASAWTGTEHLYWGGEGPGVGYEPVTGRVRRLAPGPNPFIKPLAATWTGTEVLVCCTGTEAAYDPETDEWREIAPSPMVGFGAAGAWAGDRWYVLGGSGRLTSYEPEADRWEELRAQPLAQLYSEVEWTGEVLAVTTPQSSAILLYDPAS